MEDWLYHLSHPQKINYVLTYLHYLLSRTLICLDRLDSVKCHNSE